MVNLTKYLNKGRVRVKVKIRSLGSVRRQMDFDKAPEPDVDAVVGFVKLLYVAELEWKFLSINTRLSQ